MQLQILGPMQVVRDGVVLPPRPQGQRTVLALLALAEGSPVRQEAAVEALWAGNPPRSAVGVFQTYISRLRPLLTPEKGGPSLLTRDSAGYRMRVTAENLDTLAFAQLVRQARNEATAQAACDSYEQALALWRGDPLTDVPALREHPRLTALLEERATAIVHYAELAAANGWHDRVLPHLRKLSSRDTLNERAHATLMVILAGNGRQAEALRVYEDMRKRLDDKLGVLPGPELRTAHATVLHQETTTARITSSTAGWQPVFQLPAAPADFTGRAAECGRVIEATGHDDGVPIVAISGQPGIGKTTLAVHSAHQVRDRFPDGQLWVELAGASARPRDPAEVLGELLRTCGVPGSAIPQSYAERVVVFRSTIADRRVLIMADDAASSEQVEPLLPGTPGCALIVTSRMRLQGLAGAAHIPLDVMTDEEAGHLLAGLVGHERAAAEPSSVEALAEACGHLPLALRIAGAKLATRQRWPVSALTRRLLSAHGRLEELQTENLSVRAGISTSYGLMPARHRRAFRLLSLLGPADFAEWAVPVLLGEPGSARVLDDLVNRSMVIPAGVDPAGEPRYRLHDLLRDFAAELLAGEPPERHAALTRLLAAYLQLAILASGRLPPEPFFPPAVIEDRPAIISKSAAEELTSNPVAWFTAERINLLTAVQQGCAAGQVHLARQLASCQSSFLQLQDRHEDAELIWSSIAARTDGQDVYPRLRIGASLIERGNTTRALPILDRCVDNAPDDEVLAIALYWRGACAWDVDDFDRARLDARRGIAVARQSGSTLAEIMNLRLLSNAELLGGDRTDAVSLAELAVAKARSLGVATYELAALHNLAYSCALAGLHDRSIATCQERIALSRDLGDVRAEAYCHGVLGDAYCDLGQWDLAVRHLLWALPVFEKHRALRPHALCLFKLGCAYEAMASYPKAIEYLQRAIEAFSNLDLHHRSKLAEQALHRCEAAQLS